MLTLDFSCSIALAELLRSVPSSALDKPVTCVPMSEISVARELMGTEKHDSSSCWDAASRDWNTSVWVMVVSADCKLCSCAPASCALVPIAVRLAVSVCTRALVSGMEVFCRVVFSVSMPCWSCVRPAVSCCICWRLSAERLPLRLSDRVCKPAVICALPCWSCAAPLVRLAAPFSSWLLLPSRVCAPL